MIDKIQQILEDDRERVFLFMPVLLGCGIGGYFALHNEPSLYHSLIALAITSIGLACTYRTNYKLLTLIPFLITLGFCAAKLRTDSIDNPIISQAKKEAEYTAKIAYLEHRPDSLRLTMQGPNAKFRVTLRESNYPKPMLRLGDTIRFNAVLMPPSESVVMYGYNFRLQAYFKGLSAVGFITNIPQVTKHDPPSFRDRLRGTINEFFRVKMPGNPGAIAAALVTGDRSGITKALRDSFSDSGLAHILAISGLHLSIIAGLMFFIIRRLLSFMIIQPRKLLLLSLS